MQRRGFGLTLGVLGGTCLATGAMASPAPTVLSVRQVLDASHCVVAAVAVRTSCMWVDVFGARRIMTSWSLQLSRVFGDAPMGDLRVATLGGSVGDVIQWVPHEAALTPSGYHLLFLRRGPLGHHWVTGMRQGAFQLVERGADWVVSVTREQSECDAPHSIIRTLAGLRLDQVEQRLAGAA